MGRRAVLRAAADMGPRAAGPRLAAMAGCRAMGQLRRRYLEPARSAARPARGTSRSLRRRKPRDREGLDGAVLGRAEEARQPGRRVVRVTAGIAGLMAADLMADGRNCRFLLRWCGHEEVRALRIRVEHVIRPLVIPLLTIQSLTIQLRRSTRLLAAAADIRRVVDIRRAVAEVTAGRSVFSVVSPLYSFPEGPIQKYNLGSGQFFWVGSRLVLCCRPLQRDLPQSPRGVDHRFVWSAGCAAAVGCHPRGETAEQLQTRANNPKSSAATLPTAVPRRTDN
jgi:hypothetical protein